MNNLIKWVGREIKPIDVLIKLYSECSNKLKKEFVKHLLSYFDCPSSNVPFEVLLKVKKVEDAFKIFLSKEALAHIKITMLARLYNSLIVKQVTFNEKELTFIKSQIEKDIERVKAVKIGVELKGGGTAYSEGDRDKIRIRSAILTKEGQILNRINEIRFTKVEKELEGEILEEDLHTVEEKIGQFKLSPDLSEALKKIKGAYDKAEDGFDYAKEIAYLRTFLDDLIKDIAKRIAEKTNEKIPKIPNSSEFTNNKKYLESKEIITQDESQLIDGFHSILSGSGSHKLISKKELYRLGLNMGLELSLLILTRYDSLNQIT